MEALGGGPASGRDGSMGAFGADLGLENVDQTLRDGVDHAHKKTGGLLKEAEEIKKKLEAAGAKVELK